MIAPGRAGTCTFPAKLVMVAGNPAAWPLPVLAGPVLAGPVLAGALLQAAAASVRAGTATSAARRVRARMIILRWYGRTKCVRCDTDRASERAALPPRTGRQREPGGRARPRGRGITVAGQRRNRTGFAGARTNPGGEPGTAVAYRSRSGALGR